MPLGEIYSNTLSIESASFYVFLSKITWHPGRNTAIIKCHLNYIPEILVSLDGERIHILSSFKEYIKNTAGKLVITCILSWGFLSAKQ